MHLSGNAASPRDMPIPCYGAAVRRASRILTRIYDEVLTPSGLNLTQFSIAHQLFLHGAANIGDLARWMDTDKTAMGRNLGPLEREGLVSVDEGEDRRSRRVSLTAEGITRYREALVLWRKAQKRVEKLLGKESASSLRDLLHRVAERSSAPAS